MQRKPLLWFLAGILCLVGVVSFWQIAEKRQAEKYPAPKPSVQLVKSVASSPAASTNKSSGGPAPVMVNAPHSKTAKNRYPFRLANTDQSLAKMLHNDKALLLMNALLDTGKPMNNLAIPDRLRAAPNSGSYIVQANGPITPQFRAALENAGATIISYIPNNAYLVRVSDASQLSSIGSVVTYEPYYKLDPSLLNMTMQQPSAMPPNGLTLTVFADAYQQTLNDLNLLGAQVLSQDNSPFGPVLKVLAPPGTMSALAGLPGVEGVAVTHRRVPSNDLMRPTLGVSADSLQTTPNYLGLDGTGILININDFGVDKTHPDLTNRLFFDTTNAPLDTSGHGTHVTGTVLGSGVMSYTVSNTPPGSVTNASFRGMANNAKGFVLSLSSSDAYLQETAARTNCFISNNSWNYDDSAYDIEAASYDAAVRDALPEVPGSQAMVYVFSAGNDGAGADDGTGGTPDSILSPATGKNVITVGAVEQPRFIMVVTTNLVNGTNVVSTNSLFYPETDSDDEVTSFSSRGNVGVNVEGPNGRFKPDLVAPGTFVISDRSSTWDTNAYYNPTNSTVSTGVDNVGTNSLNPEATVFIEPNTVGVIFIVTPNSFSPNPMPSLPVYAALNAVPTFSQFDYMASNQMVLPTNGGTGALNSLTLGSSITFSVGNTTTQAVAFDWTMIVLTTNDDGYFQSLSNLNNGVAPWYRYESGTSMSAAGVSGMLGLMQQFFQQQLNLTNSPALMKALLINGARTLGQPYDFSTAATTGNSQGWGEPNLPNSIPPQLALLNPGNYNPITGSLSNVPVILIDQNPTNALATGQSTTYKLALSGDGANQDLRVTLVWTDPPGSPAAGVKLVNNLQLVVTNLDSPTNPIIYFGNDIPGGSIYNESWDTNFTPNIDVVNNVQNVYIQGPVGTNYTITVLGQRVNVNAVTANTNGIVQDYALVVSSGTGGSVASPFATFTDVNTTGPVTNTASITNTLVLSNAIPLFNQRVGANSQLSGSTNGTQSQWNFYVYTNPATNTSDFTNVAIVTFNSPNLGVVRMGASEEDGPSAEGVNTNATRSQGADIDLYVSTDPSLTNLNTNAINAAYKSTGPTGNEQVLLTNSAPGTTYYIGIKSEDQEAAQFSLFAIATDQSFNQSDANGNPIVTILTPLPVPIPGGAPSAPQHGLVLGVSTSTQLIRKVTVSDTIQFPNFGDLIGTLTHGQQSSVLNNHTYFTNINDAIETFVYDDSGENVAGTRPTDPPGTLRNFVGQSIGGSVWQFVMVNDTSSDTGAITGFSITATPQPQTNFFEVTIQPNSWFYDFVDVPDTATNLTISVSPQGPGNVDLYVQRGGFPSQSSFDEFAVIPPSTGITINKYTSPPLNAGRYFYGIFNPGSSAINVFVSINLGISQTPVTGLNYLSAGNEFILDDAVMYSTNAVGQSGQVVSAEVGVRIDHQRESDLVLTLISPSGTRVLLAENRGGLDTNGYGKGYDITNFFAPTNAGLDVATTNNIPLTNSTGTLVVDYNFFTIPDDMRVYYGSTLIFDSGLVSGSGTFTVDFGPGLSTNLQIVMDAPGTNPNTNGDEWTYSATVIQKAITYATFSDDTNLATIPIKFAVPPFGTAAPFIPGSNVFTSSFEGVTAGDYSIIGNIFDGWTVSATGVASVPGPQVVTVPVLANTGSNVLALHGGAITRTVTNLIVGDSYTLSYVYHGQPIQTPISWWKGDFNYNDSGNPGGHPLQSIGLASPGFQFLAVVKQGFLLDGYPLRGEFSGVNPYRLNVGGDPPNLQLTNAITIEGWIAMQYDTIPSSIIERSDNTGTNIAYHLGFDANNNLQWYVTGPSHLGGPIAQVQWPGVVNFSGYTFCHVTATYDSVSSNLNLYVNGTLMSSQIQPEMPLGTLNSSNFPGIGLGDAGTTDLSATNLDEPFSGVLDEMSIYKRALTPLEIQDIYAAGSAGKRVIGNQTPSTASLTLDNTSYPIAAALDQWVTNTITFTASNTSMVITLASDTNFDGTKQDGILFDSFVLSQDAQNNGANYYLPEESLAKLAGENSQGNWLLEVLDNRVGPNPTNLLVSWQLSLVLADTVPFASPITAGVPQTNTIGPGGFVYFAVDVPVWAQFATNIVNSLTGGSLNVWFNQDIEPTGTNTGDYQLLTGVVNGTAVLNTNAVPAPQLLPGQRYYIGIQNPSTTTPVTVRFQVNFDITTLLNGVPVTATIASGNVPRYFQFNVDTNQAVVFFQITNIQNGNVELLARYGPPLPDTANFEYFSANPPPTPQSIVIQTNSSPVPLTPGTWYLGVFNTTTTTATYTIVATEYPLPNIITLTNGVPFTFNAAPGQPITNFFVFPITNSPSGALFELYNLSGNVDLTLDQNSIPFAPPYYDTSTQPGTNNEQIVLYTNVTTLTNLNANWYLGVPNNTTSNVTYTIRAVVSTNGMLISGIPLTETLTLPAQGSGSGPILSWPSVQGQLYAVQESTDLVTWFTIATVIAPGDTSSFTIPTPPTAPSTFFRVIQEP